MSLYDTNGPELQPQQPPRPDPYLAMLLANMQGGQQPVMEQAPQHPDLQPNFLDRLALAFQNLPQNQNVGKWGAGIQGFEQGFGASRGGEFQRQQAEQTAENQRLSASAAHLANTRWQNVKNQADIFKSIRESRDAQTKANAELARDALKAKQSASEFATTESRLAGSAAETKRHNQADEKAAALKANQPAGAGTDYSDRIKQTSLGNVYLDGTDIPLKEVQAAREYAKANGATFVDKNTAARLTALDGARSEWSSLTDLVTPSLASNPASALLTTGPMNELAALTGANPKLKAYNDSKVNVIGYLQALRSGQGSGLRITNTEFNKTIRAFPGLMEPKQSAAEKTRLTNKLFDDREMSYFRGTPGLRAPGSSAMGGAAPAGGLVPMVAPDGRQLSVPAAKVAEMEALGARKQ